MYLVETGSYVSTQVCSFKPVFPDLKTLAEEVKIITDKMGMKPYKEKLIEISTFINEFYGKVNDEGLQKWLSDNLGQNL
jgi:hypothetical protein